MATLAAFLAVLALLAWQLRTAPTARAQPVIVLRRVYETRVVDAVANAAGGRTSSTQSVSSSATASTAPPAPVARSS